MWCATTASWYTGTPTSARLKASCTSVPTSETASCLSTCSQRGSRAQYDGRSPGDRTGRPSSPLPAFPYGS
eukprot:scaffold3800_cov137-Pinguiococcus_pyrenoidosus.AAC.3